MSLDEVRRFVAEHEDPIVKASEVADEFDVTSQAANYRLNQLVERGDVRAKRMGRSAKAYWVPEGASASD
jgi:predicted ArsR family transcriptional regulator